VVLRVAVFVVQKRISEVTRAAAIKDTAIAAIEGDTQPVDLVETFLPAAGDFDFLIGQIVTIRIDNQRAARFSDTNTPLPRS